MLKIAAVAVALLFGLIVLVVVVGYALPKQHVAARALPLRQTPANVFALISNFKDEPSWRADVQQVELLPDPDGRMRFREKGKHGALTFAVVESQPPQILVTRIEEKALPFGGIWIFEISPTAGGSRLNITERGEIYNPVFRFVSRFILGYHSTMDGYLTSVARKFGETSVPTAGRIANY